MSENNTPGQNKQEHSAPENKIPSKFDLYKVALETRNFEIELFWKRSNYFLVLNTAIAVGFFNFNGNGSGGFFLNSFLCIFGLLVSLLWFRINLGSKYWQVKWEEELKRIEKYIKERVCKKNACDKDTCQCIALDMFGNEPELSRKKVFANLSSNGSLNCIDLWVLKKPSVSGTMIVLSFSFIIGWVLLLGYSCFPDFRSF